MARRAPGMTLREIDPRPRLVHYEDLPSSGVLGRGPRKLTVRPLEVALVRRRGRVVLVAPAASADETVTLAEPGETALVVPRQFRALVSVEGCRFADGAAGTVSLWAHGAIVGTDRPAEHPLTLDPRVAATKGALRDRLRDSLWHGLGPQLLGRVARIDPDPRTRTVALAGALRGLVRRDDVQTALRRDGILAFTDALKVHAVEAPERDAAEAARIEAAGRPLGLTAAWRALDESGTLNPCLSPVEALPSGTWLDVAVTVSRHAFVYVLVHGSAGRWQCLVPDRDDLLGVVRDNRQGGGRTVRWPGHSRRYPNKPYWRLDRRPGTERIAVVAALDRLDDTIERVFDAGGLDGARRRFGPRATVPTYRELTQCLLGDGRVMQELVIDHLAHPPATSPLSSHTWGPRRTSTWAPHRCLPHTAPQPHPLRMPTQAAQPGATPAQRSPRGSDPRAPGRR
ncbi:MAG: DUF4384 domain-containing protein [Planctomycetota bacterium]